MQIIGASALNNFVFCKRLFYYREVEQVDAENYYLVDGQIKHKNIDNKTLTIRQKGEKIFSKYISSDDLGIAAKMDIIEIEDGKYIPIEYKRGKLGDWLNHKVQLCAQALLIEEYYDQELEYGYLYYYGSRRRKKVELTSILRNQTLEAIEEARKLLKSERCPEGEYSLMCKGCSLYTYCLPEETDKLKKNKSKSLKKVIPHLDKREVLYITTKDVKISKKYNRIIIKKDEGTIKEIPLIKVKKIVLFGRVNLTHPVIAHLLKNNIEIVYMSYYGKYEGTLVPSQNKNGLLRKKQIMLSEDDDQCTYLARKFIQGKIDNMRHLLMRRNRKVKSGTISKTIQTLKQLKRKLEQGDNLEVIRGQEGYATRLYFQRFNELLPDNMTFEKRTKRPPTDPVNSLLSLGYSLLTKDLESHCRLIGFDPYIGYLHKDKYGKPSLALDLMEEFRPLIIDQLVLYVLNSGIITIDDFKGNEGLRLKKKAFKKFLSQYEQRKKTEFTHPLFEYKISYQRAFEVQARILAKYLTGEIDEYYPLEVKR